MLRKKGFTLVELIVSIAIIAVLAAVLTLGIGSLVRDGNKSADASAAKAITGALSATLSDLNNNTLGKEYTSDNPTVLEALEANGLTADALISKREGYVPYYNKKTARVEFDEEGKPAEDFIALTAGMSVKALLTP